MVNSRSLESTYKGRIFSSRPLSSFSPVNHFTVMAWPKKMECGLEAATAAAASENSRTIRFTLTSLAFLAARAQCRVQTFAAQPASLIISAQQKAWTYNLNHAGSTPIDEHECRCSPPPLATHPAG